MRRITVLLAVLAATLFLHAQAAAEKIITLTFTGDCTLGTEEVTRRAPDSFDSVAQKKGYDYFFANFSMYVSYSFRKFSCLFSLSQYSFSCAIFPSHASIDL